MIPFFQGRWQCTRLFWTLINDSVSGLESDFIIFVRQPRTEELFAIGLRTQYRELELCNVGDFLGVKRLEL